LIGKISVAIADTRHDILWEMLYFIYTRTPPNLRERVYDLLHAADKYALEKLKVMCQDILFLKLRADHNVTG
jgi:speckle-type POZ protein